jgi:hypothetical protein
MEMQTEFNWLRKGPVAGICEHVYESSYTMKALLTSAVLINFLSKTQLHKIS